jgi:hypothetical protein
MDDYVQSLLRASKYNLIGNSTPPNSTLRNHMPLPTKRLRFDNNEKEKTQDYVLQKLLINKKYSSLFQGDVSDVHFFPSKN